MDEMATSLQTIKHCGEQNSALIISTRSEFKEFTQKVSDVEKNLEVLECKVLKIEKQVSFSEKYNSLLSLENRDNLALVPENETISNVLKGDV